MKKTKRFFALLFACLFCFGSLAACSGGNVPADDTTPSDTTVPVDDSGTESAVTLIYVDSSVTDSGDGSVNSPLKTISEAKEKIREMKNGEGLPEGGVTVMLMSGDYYAAGGIEFTADDSGTEDCPITYMAAEEHGATVTGGITIPAADFISLSDEEKAKLNDETAKDKVLKADLKKYGVTTESLGKMYSKGAVSSSYKGNGFAELFINDERMTVSRYPNVTAEDPNLRTGGTDGEMSFDILAISEFEAQAMAIKDRISNWDLDKLWATGYFYYGWAAATVPVKELKADTLSVTLGHGVNYGIKAVSPFYLFNIFAETDEPGEYYIDSENCILYFYPTEDFENSSVVVSISSQNVFNLGGAEYINFSGLNISATRANGLNINGNHITVDNCRFYDFHDTAIQAEGTHITIQNNEVFNVGADAIVIKGGDIVTVSPSHNVVYNNYIHHWGQIGKTSEYAVFASGCGVLISHNEVHDAPHQAILWDGPNHVIEYNEVYNVCLETDDCGALYAGRRFDAYGSAVRYNYIHNIGSGRAVAQGIYLDDGLSGQTVYGNVIADVSGYGIQVGGGRDNIIENNLIINSGKSTIEYDSRARDGMLNGEGDWFYEHTVGMPEHLIQMQAQQEWLDAFPGYGDIIPYTLDYAGDPDNVMLSCNPANSKVRMNIFYFTGNKKERDASIDEDVISMGTVEENHRFLDLEHNQIPGYENGDCTLAEDAEAYKIGFEKLPFDEMGRVTG